MQAFYDLIIHCNITYCTNKPKFNIGFSNKKSVSLLSLEKCYLNFDHLFALVSTF